MVQHCAFFYLIGFRQRIMLILFQNVHYNIQKLEELRWLRDFPINFIDHSSHVHFIHGYTNTCNIKHDETTSSTNFISI